MTKGYTEKVSSKTRALLWAVSAGRCQICNTSLWKDWFTKKSGNFGEVAHIIGNHLDIPGREKVRLDDDYCNDVNNLMLLCATHHQLIDYEHPGDYPEEKLRIIKKNHEERIDKLTGAGYQQSHLVKYCANIDIHQSLINEDDAIIAMALNGRYPSESKPIILGIENSISQDNNIGYWSNQVCELEGQFNKKVVPYFKHNEETHFSVFGLAPIPLLIKLGTLFSDKCEVEVYQFHREPKQTWVWEENHEEIDYIIKEPESTFDTVALIISFSDQIKVGRIHKSMGNSNVSVWELTITQPDKDFMKSKSQLSRFRQTFRNLLGFINSNHPGAIAIHVFPAIGVAPAIEIGRVWQLKADLPLIIYDQNRELGGFVRAISIGLK